MEKVPTDIEKYGSNYSENKLKEKLMAVARKAGEKVVYTVLLGYYALQSDDLSFTDKAKLYGALGYFILPLDLIPDSIPGLGFTDDMAALLFVLNAISDHITPEVKKKAEMKAKEWLGSSN